MAPVQTIPTTIPVTAPSLQPIYCPVIWEVNGARCPVDDLSRDGVISSVACGDFTGILRIIASDPSTGRCWDATQEIAREAVAQAADRYGVRDIPRACLEFAEDVLGVMTTRALTLAAA